jgi:ribosomal protein S18 acetylase RimI-like enzyme
MFVDIRTRLQEAQFMDLLAYSVFPDEDKLISTVNEYESNHNFEIYGYMEEQEVIAVIGVENIETSVYIHHLSVHPDYRGLGYGRGVLMELIDYKKPEQLIANTDEEAVDFYRSVGFSISSLGEIFPGAEKFRCVYDINED